MGLICKKTRTRRIRAVASAIAAYQPLLGTQKHRIPLFDFSSLRLWFLGLGPSEALVTGTQADLLHGSVFSECHFPWRGTPPSMQICYRRGFLAISDFSRSRKWSQRPDFLLRLSPGSTRATCMERFPRLQPGDFTRSLGPAKQPRRTEQTRNAIAKLAGDSQTF